MTSMMLTVGMTLTEAATTLGTSSFSITGGGALYQLGPAVNSSCQVGVGIQSVASSRLGNEADGYLSSIILGSDNSLVAGNAGATEAVIKAAIDQISIQRGPLGAFERNTLRTSIGSQQIALDNLSASESEIRDTDFAAETAALTVPRSSSMQALRPWPSPTGQLRTCWRCCSKIVL